MKRESEVQLHRDHLSFWWAEVSGWMRFPYLSRYGNQLEHLTGIKVQRFFELLLINPK